MHEINFEKYIHDRIEKLDQLLSTTTDEVLKNQLLGKLDELLKMRKMIHNRGVVRTITENGIQQQRY